MNHEQTRRGDELVAALAGSLIGLRVGDQLPTIRELAATHHASSTQIHTALTALGATGAITMAAAGRSSRSGRRVADRQLGTLWRLAEQTPLIITMPLPNAARFEGLATGLRDSLEHAGVECYFQFMRGSRKRLESLQQRNCHLAVVSAFAADELLRDTDTEAVLLELPDKTFVDGHCRYVRGNPPTDRPLRVLVDRDSSDQQKLSDLEFAGEWVEQIPAGYPQLARLLADGRGDAAVWTIDEMAGQLPPDVAGLPLSAPVQQRIGTSTTRACLVARTTDRPVRAVVRQGIDPDIVVVTQQEVIDGRTPRY